MSNINRDYLIVLNPKTSKVTVPELNYYIYDKYTANLFVNLVTVENGKVVNIPDADQYKLVLHVVKPTNEIQTVENIQVFNKEKALFQIELDQELTKNIGRYKCELLTIDKTDHIVQSAKFSYRVKKSIYNDLDVVTETPQYPIIITLLDKLQDIDKYEEERRANEVARVAAEKARVKDYTDLRKTVTTDIDTMQEKIDSFDGKVQEVDNAVTQMRNNITDYQTKKNKELDDYKGQKDTQINTAIKGMETTIDTYKTEKDTEINDKITQQDNKINSAINLQNKNIQASTKALNDKLDAAVQDQNDTIAANNQAQNKVISDAVAAQNKTINTVVESDKVQNDRLDTLETNDTNNKAEIKKLQDKDVEHEERMTAIEAVNVEQNNRLDAIEIKNDQQDSRLNDVEAKNKKQDLDLKCLFAESHSERITLEDEVGNSVFLQNSKQGFATVDELKGNTLVNCNKDTDKELILNGNIDTSGYGTVTTTEGVDGGKVDVALEGNTMVNVCDQEDPIAITKSYEVTTGNHVALQGEYDGKCRPVLNGNTLVSYQKSSIDKGKQFTVNGQYQYKSISTLNTTVKDKLYFRIKFTVDELNTTSQEVNIFTHYPGGYMTPVKLFKDCTVGKIEEVSTIREHEQARADQKYMMLSIGMYAPMPEDVPEGSPVCKYTIHDYVIYNLTQLFGAGKEPEQEWCDNNLPYLQGLKSSFEDSYIPKTLVENNTQWTWSPSNKFKQILSASDTPITSSKITLVINCSSVSGYPLAVIRKVDGTDVTNLIDTKVGLNIVTLENTGTITELKLFRDNNAQGYIIDNAFIVEGDYTNYDFTNYDSSKGGKYKVDYKVTGKNKFDKSKTLDGYEINNIGAGTIAANTKWFVTDFIPVIPNTTYAISGKANGNVVPCYDENKQFINGLSSGGISQITIPNNVKYVKLNGLLTQKDTFQIEEGTTATTYEPYKEYTKTFYLNSPLLKGDTIEDVNGKVTHVHRYGKVVLDGSDDEGWIANADEGDNINGHSIYTGVNIYSSSGECMCDKLPVYNSSKEVENLTDFVILYNNGVVVVNVKGASTIGEVKSWLQANPITLISKLKTPTYETISNDSILCDSYVNGHLDVDSVIPIDKVVFQSYGTNLKYLSPNTEYIIQFESDSNGKLDALALNSSDVIGNLNIVKGINKFNITTSDKITINYLWTSGIGFNMSKVVVTPKVDGDFGYFKGMKSVGECEGNTVEIVAQNKNLFTSEVIDALCTLENWVGNDAYKSNYVAYKLMNFKDGVTYTNTIPEIKVPPQFYPILFLEDVNNGNFIASGWYQNDTDNEKNVSGNTYTFTPKNEGHFRAYVYVWNEESMQKLRKVLEQNIQTEIGNKNTDFVVPKHNKQTITHEPLRGLPNGIKDKYVIIDDKWYIERNCMAVQFKDLKYSRTDVYQKAEFPDVIGFRLSNTGIQPPILCDRFAYNNDRIINFGELLTNKENINITSNGKEDEFFITIQKAKLKTLDSKGLIKYFTDNPMEIITKATTPTYEPIEYNSFEVYSATTHISNNSNIPCNMVIRNSGFNCILKPNTTYTVSSNNGLSSVTTKASIGDSVLRFYDKDTTSITKMNKVLVLEGDYITGNPPIPAFFKGMESTFEQELVTDEQDKNYGKYKVNVKATNPDNKQENNITFYLKEPLRGVGDVKDKVYVKEDKVVVERNCVSYVLDPNKIPSPSSGDTKLYMYNIAANNSIINTRYGKVVCNSFACDVNNAHDRSRANTISTVVDGTVPDGVIRIITDKNKETLKQYLQQNPTTVVYQLATPTYEEVEYFDLKLFVEIFKDTTIIYNSNIPVTSTINYTFSVPIVEQVNTLSKDVTAVQESANTVMTLVSIMEDEVNK
jgi:hypothetical protein|uniref:BppU domain protein n=2 Tax=unclassified Caudoviricetes TaxID=2788787 RepID=A0A8S5MW58_9CAUD|nr:MAG TPA: BppU domain protein [Siphoviridae sp. ctsBB38]DAF99121.1 MAG TPA: BppU domain protein [Siphoviridae sp. ctOxh11]